MGVNALNAQAVVYLPPQAIDPLSASQIPIALALAARPDLAGHSQVALSAMERLSPSADTAGTASVGKVDVYA